MNDEWNRPGFSASDEEKKSEMPDSFSEKAESTEQAPSWGKPSEQQPWQSAQSEQNAQPFAPQQMPRYDSAPRYGEGYQNYNAPRAGQPNHARKKKNRAGLIIGISAGVICAVLIGAVIMGAFLYPIFRDYQQTPSPSAGPRAHISGRLSGHSWWVQVPRTVHFYALYPVHPHGYTAFL